MSGVRNLAEDLTVLVKEDLTIAADGLTVTSTAIDTQGYDRGCMYAVEVDAFGGAGSISYKIELSDDNITYVDAPDDSYAPSFKQSAAERILEDPQNGRMQPIGSGDGYRYQKITFTTNGVVSTATATVIPIMKARQLADTSWTTTTVPSTTKP